MCLQCYHVDAYDETAEQIDAIDLTRTKDNDVNVINETIQCQSAK